eukprot:1187999-Pleurochrysis_carterae.AAC.1
MDEMNASDLAKIVEVDALWTALVQFSKQDPIFNMVRVLRSIPLCSSPFHFAGTKRIVNITRSPFAILVREAMTLNSKPPLRWVVRRHEDGGCRPRARLALGDREERGDEYRKDDRILSTMVHALRHVKQLTGWHRDDALEANAVYCFTVGGLLTFNGVRVSEMVQLLMNDFGLTRNDIIDGLG